MATVYLAGPIAGLSYSDVTGWRSIAQDLLAPHGIDCLSPMRFKHYLQDEAKLKDAYSERPLSSAKGIVARDRFDVHRCDVMLAYLVDATEVSKGTMIEFGWADAYRKPIIAVMGESNCHWHGMVCEIAGYIVPTLYDGLDIVKALLVEGRQA